METVLRGKFIASSNYIKNLGKSYKSDLTTHPENSRSKINKFNQED